ncbi:hypothetical protein, partial [Campylobacter sp.]|uniref:hypothetical protein n=1 Tax=Campylobacter sp. TaxID=205 RepID=UPI0026DD22E9
MTKNQCLATSVIAILFLSSDAYAQIQGQGCNNQNNCTINSLVNGTHRVDSTNATLSLTSNGTIWGWYHNVPLTIPHTKTLNLLYNEGTIEQKGDSRSYFHSAVFSSRNFLQKAEIKTIINKGLIGAPLNAQPAFMLANSTITSLDNQGTIRGGIQLVTNNTHIKTLNNRGLITSAAHTQFIGGYAVNTHMQMDSFTNSGTIEGFYAAGGVKTFTNSGTIKRHKENHRNTALRLDGQSTIVSLSAEAHIENGIELRGTIQSLTNDSSTLKITNYARGQIQNLQGSGTITSLDNQGTIKTLNNTMNGNLTNSGKIESGSITFQSGQLTNQQSGTIGGTVSGTITSLDNRGTIKTLNN